MGRFVGMMGKIDVKPTSGWSADMQAEYRRRRRGRNRAMLIVLMALCALVYAVAVVKLFEAGKMW